MGSHDSPSDPPGDRSGTAAERRLGLLLRVALGGNMPHSAQAGEAWFDTDQLSSVFLEFGDLDPFRDWRDRIAGCPQPVAKQRIAKAIGRWLAEREEDLPAGLSLRPKEIALLRELAAQIGDARHVTLSALPTLEGPDGETWDLEPETARSMRKEACNRLARFLLEPLGPAGTTSTGRREAISSAVEKVRAARLPDRTRQWVLDDQIAASGGWGQSQAAVMAVVSGEPPTELERQEGGIISTLVALRGLRAQEATVEAFQTRPAASAARSYLTSRQSHGGAFGRHVRSRSGTELHTSIRHTAFAVLALLELGGPHAAIVNGLQYLRGALVEKSWWRGDASPPLALAGVVRLSDRLTREDAHDLSQLPIDADTCVHELAELALASPEGTMWPGYAAHRGMVYDTALTVIDLMPHPLPVRFRPTVRRVLVELTSQIDPSGGLPYGPGFTTGDIGVSAFLLSVLVRRSADCAQDSEGRLVEVFDAAAVRLAAWLVGSWTDEEAWRMTYCDTLSNLLLMGPTATEDRY